MSQEPLDSGRPAEPPPSLSQDSGSLGGAEESRDFLGLDQALRERLAATREPSRLAHPATSPAAATTLPATTLPATTLPEVATEPDVSTPPTLAPLPDGSPAPVLPAMDGEHSRTDLSGLMGAMEGDPPPPEQNVVRAKPLEATFVGAPRPRGSLAPRVIRIAAGIALLVSTGSALRLLTAVTTGSGPAPVHMTGAAGSTPLPARAAPLAAPGAVRAPVEPVPVAPAGPSPASPTTRELGPFELGPTEASASASRIRSPELSWPALGSFRSLLHMSPAVAALTPTVSNSPVSLSIPLPLGVTVPVSIPASSGAPVNASSVVTLTVPMVFGATVPISIPAPRVSSAPLVSPVPVGPAVALSVPLPIGVAVPVRIPVLLGVSVPISVPEPVVASIPAAAPEPVAVPEPLSPAVAAVVPEPVSPAAAVVVPEPVSPAVAVVVPEPVSPAVAVVVPEPVSAPLPFGVPVPLGASLPLSVPAPFVAPVVVSAPAPFATPEPISVPQDGQLVASRAEAPHQRRYFWHPTLELILAQAQAPRPGGLRATLLGGGWDPFGLGALHRAPIDASPPGLGFGEPSELQVVALLQAPLLDAPPHTPTDTFAFDTLAQGGQDPSGTSPRLQRAADNGRWTHEEIPLEAIGASATLLTPGVGNVRAVLAGGEVFEGRLHAVGGSQVWLDTSLGRMSLEYHRITSLQRLSGSRLGASVAGDALGSRDPDSLPQVRVILPGGALTGALLARDGLQVTLLTPSGLQITVASDDVQPLSGREGTLGIRPREDL